MAIDHDLGLLTDKDRQSRQNDGGRGGLRGGRLVAACRREEQRGEGKRRRGTVAHGVSRRQRRELLAREAGLLACAGRVLKVLERSAGSLRSRKDQFPSVASDPEYPADPWLLAFDPDSRPPASPWLALTLARTAASAPHDLCMAAPSVPSSCVRQLPTGGVRRRKALENPTKPPGTASEEATRTTLCRLLSVHLNVSE